MVRTLSRAATSIQLAAVRGRMWVQACVPPTFDPREEPGALAALAGICAGGEEKSSSLPRPRNCTHPQNGEFRARHLDCNRLHSHLISKPNINR